MATEQIERFTQEAAGRIQQIEVPEGDDVYAVMDRLDGMNAVEGITALGGYSTAALVYQYGSVIGLSAPGVFALANQVGGFDVRTDTDIVTFREAEECPTCAGKGSTQGEEGLVRCVNCAGAGSVEKPRSYYKATATVTRTVINSETGDRLQNRFGLSLLQEKKKERSDESLMTQRSLETKAARNALRKHLAGMLETVQEFLREARKANLPFAPSDAPEEMREAARTADAQRAYERGAKKVPIGFTQAEAFAARISEVAKTCPEPEKAEKALRSDMIRFAQVKWSCAIKDAPEECLPILEARLDELAAKLRGGAGKPAEEAPAYSAEGKPLEDFTPTAKELATFLASLDADTRNDVLTKVGADPEKPMTAEQRKTAWAEGHQAIEGDGHIQGALKLEAE